MASRSKASRNSRSGKNTGALKNKNTANLSNKKTSATLTNGNSTSPSTTAKEVAAAGTAIEASSAPITKAGAIAKTDVTSKEPQKKVNFGFNIIYALANTVFWLTIIPLQTLLMPSQVEALDAANKEGMLALVLSATGAASILAQPLAGALSDRTTFRFGRRRPWIALGLVMTIVSMVLLANANSVASLAVVAGLWGFVLGFIQTPLLAIIPDKVPVKQRAVVSAFAGLAQPLGILIGTILIAEVIKNVQTSYYVITAILTVVLVLFILLVREEPLPKAELSPFSFKEFITGFFSPLKSADFTYTWIARFFIILAQIILAQYLLYYLRDVIKYEQIFTGQKAEQGFAIYQGIQTVALVLSTIIAGFISDKIQRRKPFVIVASLIMTVALLLIAFVPTWTTVLVAAVVFGIGFGVYISADIALATQVLPAAESQGRDLGLISSANILPQLLFPVVYFAAFEAIKGGYPALFAIGAGATVIGALLIIPIKGVR